jgi:hypothetical protein
MLRIIIIINIIYLFIFLKEQNYSKISHVRYLSPLYMLVPTKIKKKVSW